MTRPIEGNTVSCCICGIKRRNLTKHLKTSHNLTALEYKTVYNCDIVSKYVSNTIIKHRVKTTNTKEYKNKISNILKDALNKPGVQEKRINSFKEHIKQDDTFIKNMAKKQRERLRSKEEREKMSYRTKQYMTDSMKSQISNKMKDKWNEPSFREKQMNYRNSNKFKQIITISNIKNWNNKEYRDKCLRKYIGGKQQFIGKRTLYKGYYLKSNIELEMAKYLDYKNIKWLYEETSFNYFNKEKDRYAIYIPDFFLPDYNTYIEIKHSNEMNSEIVKDKISAVQARGYRCLLITEKDVYNKQALNNIVNVALLSN